MVANGTKLPPRHQQKGAKLYNVTPSNKLLSVVRDRTEQDHLPLYTVATTDSAYCARHACRCMHAGA